MPHPRLAVAAAVLAVAVAVAAATTQPTQPPHPPLPLLTFFGPLRLGADPAADNRTLSALGTWLRLGSGGRGDEVPSSWAWPAPPTHTDASAVPPDVIFFSDDDVTCGIVADLWFRGGGGAEEEEEDEDVVADEDTMMGGRGEGGEAMAGAGRGDDETMAARRGKGDSDLPTAADRAAARPATTTTATNIREAADRAAARPATTTTTTTTATTTTTTTTTRPPHRVHHRRRRPRVRCVDTCVHDAFPRLNMSCVIAQAVDMACTPLVCLINSDIALGDDFLRAAGRVFFSASNSSSSSPDPRTLMVGRRTDVQLSGRLDFTDPTWATGLRDRAANGGAMHGAYGIDYLVTAATGFWNRDPTTNTPAALAMPPFLVGVYRWDSYVMASAIAHPDVAVVDATAAVTALHLQGSAVGREPGHAKRAGSVYADRLVRSLIGGRYLAGHTGNADYELGADGGLVARFEG